MIFLGFLRICHSDTFHIKSPEQQNFQKLIPTVSVNNWLMMLLTNLKWANIRLANKSPKISGYRSIQNRFFCCNLCTLFRLRLNKCFSYSCTIHFQCHLAHIYFSLSLLVDHHTAHAARCLLKSLANTCGMIELAKYWARFELFRQFTWIQLNEFIISINEIM